MPEHVAIIMDGNGRWAKDRGLPRMVGHIQGVDALRRTARAAIDLGIRCLTVYGFSLENWSRPPLEVDNLMSLLRRYLRSELTSLIEQGIRLRVIGDRALLPVDIVDLIDVTEAKTRNNRRLELVVALSYSGRQEILGAAKRLAAASSEGRIDPAAIDQVDVCDALETAGLPDPDLVIRAGGERRISNFLLWQSAHSHLVFLKTPWPAFGEADLIEAVRRYHDLKAAASQPGPPSRARIA